MPPAVGRVATACPRRRRFRAPRRGCVRAARAGLRRSGACSAGPSGPFLEALQALPWFRQRAGIVFDLGPGVVLAREAAGDVADRELLRRDATALALDPDALDEVRDVVRRLLLLDLLALDPVREALHVHRPAAYVRQHRLGDALVVAGELGLGQAIREERLVRVGDLDRDTHRPGRSSTTSRGSLSRRRPRKRGWRSLPSPVSSVKPIRATSSGRVQCTALRGNWSLAKGGSACSSGASRAPRSRRTASL